MGEISRPAPPKAPCEHTMPSPDEVPWRTKWYCDGCCKVFMAYADDYGNRWGRWPIDTNRACALGILGFVLLIVLLIVFVPG